MKKWFILGMLLIATLAFAADVKISELPVATSVTPATDVTIVNVSGVTSQVSVANLTAAKQANLNLVAGTMTNTYLCTYTTAGTLLSCNTNPAGFQPADADLTTYAGITPSANVQTMLGSANNAAIVSNIGAAPAAGSTAVVSYGPTALQSASCTANALTLTPTAGLGIVNISVTQTGDANCAVTMGETSAVEGTVAIIKNISDGAAETLTFTTSANVLRLIQGSPFAMGINETLILQYKGSEWLEIGRASATVAVTSVDVPGGSGNTTRVGLDAVGIADAAWNGTTITLACGEDITAPAPVYVKSDGKAWKANAAAAATMPAIGLMVETCDVDASESKKILIHGIYRKDASYAFTVGATIYVDDSAAGVLTHTVGDISGTDHVVQVFGVALDADYLLVNPTLSTITLE